MITTEKFPEVDPKFIETLNDMMCSPAHTYLKGYGYNIEIAWANCDNVDWMVWILLVIDQHNFLYGITYARFNRIRTTARKWEYMYSPKQACGYIRSQLPEITPLLPKKEKI